MTGTYTVKNLLEEKKMTVELGESQPEELAKYNNLKWDSHS
jgi:hypothetical protein